MSDIKCEKMRDIMNENTELIINNVSTRWIFGYGSLLYKTGFNYLNYKIGFIKNYKRRFWQKSRDHRGTEEYPGRVVTLIPMNNHKTYGKIYQISDENWLDVINYLTFREKGGYSATVEDIYVKNDDNDNYYIIKALLFRGTIDNFDYVGEENEIDTANIISKAIGPSGPNYEYLYNIANELRKMQVYDDIHIFELEKLVRKLKN